MFLENPESAVDGVDLPLLTEKKHSIIKQFNHSFNDIHSESFKLALKNVIRNSTHALMILKNNLQAGGHIDETSLDLIIITTDEDCSLIKVKVGIFYQEITSGYCCGEEEPISSAVYCDLTVQINKRSATIFIK